MFKHQSIPIPEKQTVLFSADEHFRTYDIDHEKRLFTKMQEYFCAQFESVFPDKQAPKTVVIIPSLTLDEEILQAIKGVIHYEERLLCLLMLLRMPRTHVVYVTSMPVDPMIVDYYLHLLPGITGDHARSRLKLLSCHDASNASLTDKILKRPRLIQRIRESIPAGHLAHITSFNVTDAERKLAVAIGIPVYGCDPSLSFFGTKSGSRTVFRAANVSLPPGFENLSSEAEVVQALADLKNAHPEMRKAVVKLNDGFSGDGNAIFRYEGLEAGPGLLEQIRRELPQRLAFVGTGITYELFMSKFPVMQGIVEAFIDGERKESPSVQVRINPLGKVDIISTHDQLLGGESGQVFIGARFPASTEYAVEIAEEARKITVEMAKHGVLGRFAIDFMSVQEAGKWTHYAIEVNLRKGGTTHPFLMLQFLTDGVYDALTGIYRTPTGHERHYVSSDNLQNDAYIGLTPNDLMDIAIFHGLMYDGATQEGVMFHLIGALSQFGKLGIVCVGSTPERAVAYYSATVAILNNEVGLPA